MFILLVSLVAVVGVAMFVARTADHGEARFDSDTGETLATPEPQRIQETTPATRKDNTN